MAERQSYTKPCSQSSVAMCLRCRRCFLFKHRWCIVPKFRPIKVAASLGQIVHRLQQVGPEGINTVRKEVTEQIEELAQRIDAGEDLLGEIERAAKKLQENLDKAVAMVQIMWEKYPKPANHKTLLREKSIRMKMTMGTNGEEVELVGIPDELVENTDTGEVWVRDSKTSTRDVQYTLTGYQYGLQKRIYRILATEFLEEQGKPPPVGFIIDLLQVPTIKYCPTTKDKEGFNHYIDRCRKWYEEKGDNAIRRFALPYTESIMPEELGWSLITVAAATSAPAEPKLFPRDITGSYCTHYERVCDYYELCSKSESAWDAIIEEKFEVRPPKQKTEGVKK